MTHAATFWDKAAPRYSQKPVADETVYQRKLDVTRSYLTKEMKLLEIGCGTGSTALSHAPFVKHLLATDFSTKMIDIARAKADAGRIDNVTFDVSAAEDALRHHRSVDGVLALNVLHLLEDRKTTLSSIYDSLNEGGVFVSSTACLGDMNGLFKYVIPMARYFGLIPPINVFTRRELENELFDAGFTIDYQWQPGKNQAVFLVAKKPFNA